MTVLKSSRTIARMFPYDNGLYDVGMRHAPLRRAAPLRPGGRPSVETSRRSNLRLVDPHFQPGTRPACSIHLCISGPFASSRVFTLTYRLRSVVPRGGGGSKSAPPRKTTFTETS